jgi:putative ABC transport system ATP-binding protein
MDTADVQEPELARIRNGRIGFVFQNFNLIPSLNVLENVGLPFLYAPPGRRKGVRDAMDAISRVGLFHRMHHLPGQLSGGEMQRAAIARALAADPELILADEPTGNLDAETGSEILELLAGLHSTGRTILLVTHDPGVAGFAERVRRMENGILT